jgi:hypothetical protein
LAARNPSLEEISSLGARGGSDGYVDGITASRAKRRTLGDERTDARVGRNVPAAGLGVGDDVSTAEPSVGEEVDGGGGGVREDVAGVGVREDVTTGICSCAGVGISELDS